MTRRNSGLNILRAVHAVIAVAEVRRTSRIGCHRLLSEKVTGRDQPNCGFLAGCGRDRDLGPTFLKIEDAVGRVSLGEECFRSFQLDESFDQARRSLEIRKRQTESHYLLPLTVVQPQ